eukprot:Skav218604  [mRNA]  locus=scaffold2815:164711:173814:- [translate_table: standard]
MALETCAFQNMSAQQEPGLRMLVQGPSVEVIIGHVAPHELVDSLTQLASLTSERPCCCVAAKRPTLLDHGSRLRRAMGQSTSADAIVASPEPLPSREGASGSVDLLRAPLERDGFVLERAVSRPRP